MFYDILDKKRKEILPLFNKFKKDFYLAGGTALALQLGHRDSADFDFFSQKKINTLNLFEDLRRIFKGHKIIKIQEEKNTLTVIIDENIKVSFFTYPYFLLYKTINEKNLKLASVRDIGCMKLSAVVNRATNKDYIDLYFILHEIPLAELLILAKLKFPELDKNLILKSLTYFKDLDCGQIKFKHNHKLSFNTVKKYLKIEVNKVALKSSFSSWKDLIGIADKFSMDIKYLQKEIKNSKNSWKN